MGLEMLFGIGAVILLAALVWGTTQYRNRSRRSKEVSEQIVRERYRNNEG